MAIKRRKTRAVHVGDLVIGDCQPISIQSMCATRTQDTEATLRQIELLLGYGADIIRVAVDSERDVSALAEIRPRTTARLAVDLQENYRLAVQVAPYVQKIRYNPGHLHHHQRDVSVRDKVRFIVNAARGNGCAIRIGINFGSLDPQQKAQSTTSKEVALSSAREHVTIMEELQFSNYVVSLKSANPNEVIEINQEFAAEFPSIPLHLGVTEAGLLPMGEIKTRVAFENLLALGVGDTLRASLTLPF